MWFTFFPLKIKIDLKAHYWDPSLWHANKEVLYVKNKNMCVCVYIYMHANEKVVSMQMYIPTYLKSGYLSQVEPALSQAHYLDRQDYMQILFMKS